MDINSYGYGGSQHILGSAFDPSRNNQPLQFKPNQGPPMPIYPDSSQDMDVDRRDNTSIATMAYSQDDVDMRYSQAYGQSAYDQTVYQAAYGDTSSTEPTQSSSWDVMNPIMGMIQGMWNQQQVMGTNPMVLDIMCRKVLHLKSCSLYPPPPNAAPPSHRTRPPGCRTIFLGGLPETCTEEVIQEVFLNFGELLSIRLSKKNFAHLRYVYEPSVDGALMLSGYRMKIENKDDKPNTGRIHVDYAEARDDLYDWECQQRALYREMRHQQRMQEDFLRPPSPPPVSHYSDHEAQTMMEAMKTDKDTVSATVEKVATWLEQGDCNRRNSATFYSLLQSVNAHLRHIAGEKEQSVVDYETMKTQFRQKMQTIVKQFEQIDRVFGAATKQRAWDHFTKAQRKNLELWRKQSAEQKAKEQAEMLRERREDEMEMSDSEESMEPAAKRRKEHNNASDEQELARLEEQELLRLANENEKASDGVEKTIEAGIEGNGDGGSAKPNESASAAPHDSASATLNDSASAKQLALMQKAFHGMQQQLIRVQEQARTRETELKNKVEALEKSSQLKSPEMAGAFGSDSFVAPFTSLQTRLVGLLSTFLSIHPNGASMDYMWSYLQQFDLTVPIKQLEDVLERCPLLFEQTNAPRGVEGLWKFIGYTSKRKEDKKKGKESSEVKTSTSQPSSSDGTVATDDVPTNSNGGEDSEEKKACPVENAVQEVVQVSATDDLPTNSNNVLQNEEGEFSLQLEEVSNITGEEEKTSPVE